MHIQRSLLLAAVLALGVGPVLAQGDAKVQERRQEIDSNAQATLDALLTAQPGVRELYERATGYAVFTVTKGGFIVPWICAIIASRSRCKGVRIGGLGCAAHTLMRLPDTSTPNIRKGR